MYSRLKRVLLVLMLAAILTLPTGCWSSQEIEDLALYTGVALDKGQPAPVEKAFEGKGGTYSKRNKVMATIQIVPIKFLGNKETKQGGQQPRYLNISGSGDSIIEIFRQFSIRLDRPIIGHHLKVVVISSELLRKHSIEQLTDFMLRDNDIRPSTMMYVSKGAAKDTLLSKQPNEVPSYHLSGIPDNRSRTSKVMKPVTLSQVDALTHARKSFALQMLVSGGGETEVSGAGIIKGSTGKWLGSLNQEDAQCLSWLSGEGRSGVIKTYDEKGRSVTYELKTMKSKITPRADGDGISFTVDIDTEGRLIEIWDDDSHPSSAAFAETIAKEIQEKLEDMMQHFMNKLQIEYKVDVAGFGNQLAMQRPAAWKKVKDDWDEVFSRSRVTFNYKLKITDFGSFTEE